MLRPLGFAFGLALIGTAAGQVPPPPPPPPPIFLPLSELTTTQQCFGGGWQKFGVFKNQGDCVSYVASKHKNQPAGGTQPPPPPPPPPPN